MILPLLPCQAGRRSGPKRKFSGGGIPLQPRQIARRLNGAISTYLVERDTPSKFPALGPRTVPTG